MKTSAAAPLRVLIVDDARLARAELRTLLAQIELVELVGEAEDVPQACAEITRLHPDLVLLDIQMPSGSGFDVLDALERVPAVVFTTAYDQYALRAFEANALDYLLKPVDPARLAAAIDKARQPSPPATGTVSGDDTRSAPVNWSGACPTPCATRWNTAAAPACRCQANWR